MAVAAAAVVVVAVVVAINILQAFFACRYVLFPLESVISRY